MDLHTPLDPADFSHLRLSTMTRSRRGPHVCCICHGRLTGPRDSARLMHLRLCPNPECLRTADALDWLVV